MAEKKKYNSILISGRKDQTLTYTKYIKDEESGESVKESLDKKVNVTDKLETQQIKDGAITNEKMAADSVGNTNLQDGSVSNEKLEDGSITNDKLAENSITKDKLKDNTIGVEKLDPELRQTINAATGLPDNLVETIQNVDDTLKDHQSQLDDKQSQIDDKQQQITANDEDISLLQTRSTQMEETIKSIAATGGASQATAVTYNNEKSKLNAINIQSAVDEVVDKTVIKNEEGILVETPFSYIQNEEFIFANVDANDKLLFGIQWDGTPVFGKTSAVEERLQAQVNLLADKIRNILGDDDTTSAIDTLKELKNFFASIDNTQTLTSILANLNATIDKVAIKDEAGEIQDTPFRVIENEEFIMAVVDSEDKVLFGIYRATGKPYYPLNEMYHVEQNEEFFAVWLDAVNHVLLGIRRDGQIIGEIHAVNVLKQVVSSLQENVDTIMDSSLKELIDVFSLQNNEEYLEVETDAEGKVLSATNFDGSHYIHNVKSETIPEEFEHIEDPEGRIEITTDAENKILGYRDSEGTRHEHKISVNHIELSDKAAEEAYNAISVYRNSSNLKNRIITQLFKTAPSVTLDKELMVHCACIATSINYGHFIAYYGDNENRSEAQNSTCDFVLRNVSVLNPNNNVEIARFKTNSNVCGYSTGNKPIYDPNILMINDIVYLFVAAYSADRNEYEIIMLTYNPSTKEWADYSQCNLIYNGNSYNFSATSIKTIYQDKFNLTPEVTIISPTSKIVKDGEYYYTAIGVGGRSYTGFIVRTRDKTNWEIVDFIPVSYGFGNVGEVCMNIKDGIAYLIMRDDISSHKISRTTFDLVTKEWGELYDIIPSQRSKGWVEVYNGNIYYFYNSGDFNSGSYNIYRAIFECKKLNTSTNELEDVFTVTSDDSTNYPYIENFLGTLYLVYTQERRKYLRNICLISINNFLNI